MLDSVNSLPANKLGIYYKVYGKRTCSSDGLTLYPIPYTVAQYHRA
ncbi:hypothetical protein D1AOALGA4SA_4286 [Olavius algarvensis Delta 1 endosymbiont]|nr:hypothetical protein D1AOALGA4SA_4286 [Olavius algarvensis Delta 1 endosymbiont]